MKDNRIKELMIGRWHCRYTKNPNSGILIYIYSQNHAEGLRGMGTLRIVGGINTRLKVKEI